MALFSKLATALLLIGTAAATPARKGKNQKASSGPVTCPGFAGYCSESYPGDTCLVVCARGRNNVPECQDDGTWTDVPRCIEHEPGVASQVPGVCPGIPGYCSLDLPGGLCTFDCPIGPKIRSSCTPDGTWDPYPTCEGDPRETQDGCNPCPGPVGGPRNRTAEAGGGNGNRNSGGNGNRNNGGNSNRNNGGNSNRNSGGNGNRNGGGNSNRNGGGNNHQAAPARRNQNNNRGGGGAGNRQQNNRPAPRANNRSSGGGGKAGNSVSSCPGDVLQACIDVCPGFSPRVFGACVAGCAKRCPAKK